MPMNEFRKVQMEQKHLDEVLDKIAEKKSKDRRKKLKMSYPIHTPKEALRNLGNRTIPKCWPVDLQNLVTSVILKETSEFSIDDIYNGVRARLIGSDYYDSLEVKQCCEDTIETLFINNCLKSVGHGKYKLAMSSKQ